MTWKITEKMRPFSHLPGTSLLLPQTFWKVEVFPSLLHLKDPEGKTISISWQLPEVMEEFSIFQDLQKGEIEVDGRWHRQSFRFVIRKEGENIALRIKKGPQEGIKAHTISSFSSPQTTSLVPGQTLLFALSLPSFTPLPFERFSLGSHKQQDVDLIRRRKDLKEILPLWFLLSQWIPAPSAKEEGLFPFLKRLKEMIAKGEKKESEQTLLLLWQVGFSSFFVPRGRDEDHLGPFEKVAEGKPESAFLFLSEGFSLLRSLFLQVENEKILLLPCLPPSLPWGRLMGAECSSLGRMDIEWRARVPRRVRFFSKEEGKIQICCPSPIRSFRLRSSMQERGRKIFVEDFLQVEKTKQYFFDRFEK